MRDRGFEGLDRDFGLLDLEVDFVGQLVPDRDRLLQRVGERDFLGAELAQLDRDVVQPLGFEFVRLEHQFVPQLADGLAQEAQGASALERLQRREVQLVLFGGARLEYELRLAQQALAVHEDVERARLGARVVDLDRELDHLLLVALERDRAVRVGLLGDHLDDLPPVLALVVREGDAARELARHLAVHGELVELGLARLERELGLALDARDVRLHLVRAQLVALVADLHAALDLGPRLAARLDVLDGARFGGDAVYFVADHLGRGLVLDHELGGPLADPGRAEGQVLVVAGAPAHGQVAAAREALGVVVHLQLALHVLVHGGLVDDRDGLRHRHARGAGHLQLVLGHRGDHVHLQLHQPDVQRVVDRLERHERVEDARGRRRETHVHLFVFGVACSDVDDLVALELRRGVLDRPLSRFLLELLGARGAFVNFAFLVVHLGVAFDQLRLRFLELHVHDVEDQLDVETLVLLTLPVYLGLVQVGHVAAAREFVLELAHVRVGEHQLVLEKPVFEGQELHLDRFGLAALELDVGLLDPERIGHSRVALVVDAALVQFVLVLVLFLLALVFLDGLVEVLLGDEVGEADGEVYVFVEGVGHVHVHVFDQEHFALHFLGARGSALDHSRHEVEYDRGCLSDAVFRSHDRKSALVFFGHSRFVIDSERDFLSWLND